MKSTENIVSGAPYSLLTTTDTASWSMDFATKGAIATRVVDASGNTVEGAVVTAASTLHPDTPYAVTYRDESGTFGGAATYGNGRFYVMDVDDGDIVIVTATKSGYTFQERIFLVSAGGVCQGRVRGTVGLLPGDVNHDDVLSLADAIAALQVTVRMTPTVYKDADVNGDEGIGLPEAIYVLQKIAELR
jgi:hypothetical protein